MTTCYWIEEVACIEDCENPNLPPLPGDFVVWDETPAVLAGRTISPTFPRGSAWIEIVASPNIIVIGCNSNWRLSKTFKSYLVCVSSDHGFTWQGYDKYPFVNGTVVGYESSYYDAQWQQYSGTAIAYDEEGGEFFSVDGTMNDESGNVAKLKTSRSTDGVNWTTQTVADINYSPVWCEAYNGTVWYIGYNTVGYYEAFPSQEIIKMSLRASTNGGATWVGQTFGTATFQPWDNLNKAFTHCSANAQGLHVIDNAYDDISGFTNLYYYRPTSNTTWAAPVELWADTYDLEPVYLGTSNFIIASRATPGNIYVGLVDRNPAYYTVMYRRSVDNGLTWSTAAVAWAGSAAYNLSFSNGVSSNGIRVVELDDGRLVLVTLGQTGYAYAVSENSLATGFGPITKLQEGGLSILSTQFANYSPLFEATNKGNDVVIAWCNDSPGGGDDLERSLVFRP